MNWSYDTWINEAQAGALCSDGEIRRVWLWPQRGFNGERLATVWTGRWWRRRIDGFVCTETPEGKHTIDPSRGIVKFVTYNGSALPHGAWRRHQ